MSLYGQTSIKGIVIDSNEKPIFFVTVALYSLPDSNYVDALSTDEEGLFEFKQIDVGDYYVVSSMLGYADYGSEALTIPAANPIFLRIKMEADAQLLETVEIKEKLPLLEQRADKLVVNVENNMTNTNGNLLDVMRKVPGMLVINDRLSMPGVGSPTILIDGRSTQYMDMESLLKEMPGDNIKKIEIIHQPGAEYEAAGSGPILNIILKKNALFGTNGNLTLGAGKGELWDYTTGLNLSHYAGDVNLSGGIGYSKNAWLENLSINRILTGIGDDFDGTYTQVSDERARPDSYRANIRVDWDITEKYRIGLQSKYYSSFNDYVGTNLTEIKLVDEAGTSYSLNSINTHDKMWSYQTVNPYFIMELDTSGQKLQFDLSSAFYKVDNSNILVTSDTDSPNELFEQQYIQPGNTKIFASSVDYTKPFNKSIELKTGAKFSWADLDNDLQSSFKSEGQWINNPQQSNHYLFDEKIYAAYSKLSWNADKWSGTAGLRYEHSESEGNSLTLDSIQTRTISKLFPSASISRKLGKVLDASVAYSYRVNRPRYSSLNPFVYYLDPFTYQSGNPNLRPELTHSLKFSLSYEGQPFFNIEYKRSDDAIVEVTEQEKNNQEAFKTDVNFDLQENFSTSLFFPLDFIPGINGYAGVIVANNTYNSLYNDAQFNRGKWSTTTFLQANFTLPWEINGEIGGWYNSGTQEGIFDSEYLYGTSLGLSKKFLENKLKVSVGFEDFFNRFWHANVDYQQDMNLVVRWQAPVVNARVSYKFGNQHLKSQKRHEGSADDILRRATSN